VSPISALLLRGMLMPAMRAIYSPVTPDAACDAGFGR
jgi:hypothetical protein